MSYDLFFCREKGAKLDFEEVAAWLLKRPHFKRSAETQLWYGNPATGVYFCIEHDRVEEPDECPLPPDYENVELVFNMNFNRPSFFAHEAMPVVEHFIQRFGLLVVDDESAPQVMNAQSLIASWSESNDLGVKALIKEPGFKKPLFMPRSKSLAWWRYEYAREKLESELGEGVFVPSLVPWRKKKAREVGTAFTWVAGIPTIVPESDYVAVVRERKRFMRPTEKEVGVVSSEVIREIAGEFLESYDDARSLKILPERNVGKAEKALLNMDLKPNRDEFTQVAPDGFVDKESLS